MLVNNLLRKSESLLFLLKASNRWELVRITTILFWRRLISSSCRRIRFGSFVINYPDHRNLLHQINEIFVLRQYQPPYSSGIIDGGAGIGISLLFLKKEFPHSKIIAIEPDPVAFSFLEKNIADNQLRDVDARNVALWSHVGKSVLYCDCKGDLQSSLIEGHCHHSEMYVDTIKITDLFYFEIDCIKLDVEGAEFEVVKSYFDSGNKLRAKHLIIEFHEYIGCFTKDSFVRMIKKEGYNVIEKRLPRWRQKSQAFINILLECHRG